MFAKRRGLRAVVSTGPRVGDRVELTLVCGHTAMRHHKSVSRSAVCKACAASDGKRADSAKAKREAAE